ncbi:MAG: hypothetical protein M1826_006140 [Phylliscum demangeonii]|nr:MAG: hypothetical protein M1826_006140 [Phylliscum demangeonii]
MPCLVTGYQAYVELAHLVPKTEWEWFASNQMRRHNDKSFVEGEVATNDVRNAIPLCVHIRKCFDDKKFAIVPKHGQWTTHFLTETASLTSLHHNTTVQLDPIVSSAFVLARLAAAVLPLHSSDFLRTGAERFVTLLDSNARTWTTARKDWGTAAFTTKEDRILYDGMRLTTLPAR